MTPATHQRDISSQGQDDEPGLDSRVSEFLALLRQWNEACSLVSKGDLQHLNERHVADSMELLPFLKRNGPHLDLGTGGGFPGVIIAIARPRMRVVLNDRSRKKCRFLRHVKMQLDLANTEVLELDIKRDSRFQERFDTVTMRGVGNAQHVWETASQFLNESGAVLLQTSHVVTESMVKGARVRSSHETRRGWVSVVGTSAEQP